MYLKRLLPLVFLFIFSTLFAEDSSIKFKLYGFVRNDFYYNSRVNQESLDGLFYIYPKAVELNSTNQDKNAVPQAEMLSIASRVGFDITGSSIFGASSSAKIEADFAGFSTNYYVLRIRQAYAKLNWKNTELLVGQTWHPLFGSVMPTVLSLNTGAPYQPFNRSPQVRVKQILNSNISLTAAAIYQMQYTSQGPLGASASYIKNAIVPNLFIGTEYKSNHWTSGACIDLKTIKPSVEEITSVSAEIYTQYINPVLQVKAKALWGQNLSDHQILSGYGVSGINPSNGAATYTNFNAITSWLNVVYGTKWQVGAFIGLSKNMGTSSSLLAASDGKFTVYGCGYTDSSQQLLDRLIRLSPQISYNLPNFRLGLELDYSTALYGTVQNSGLVSSPYKVDNKRIVATMSYIF
ncbi:MAG: hypothetical protein WCL70_00610 [Paludibacter sp.]